MAYSYQALTNISKVELHCHLIGVISPLLLEDLQKKGINILVPPLLLKQCYPVDGAQKFLDWLTVLKPYQGYCISQIKPVLEQHINNLIQQNVSYTELMISPTIFSPETDILLEEFAEFRNWTISKEKELVQVEFLMVIPRSLPEELFERNIEIYTRLWQQKLIAGIAVVGLENNQSLKRLYPILKKFKDLGMSIEVHAGEHTGPESVWDALNFGLADRIGHGISIFKDTKLLDYIQKQNVHIEFAVTSNIRLKSVHSLDAHPIRLAKRYDLNYSINTDDPGAFDCSMVDEFNQAQQLIKLTKQDFYKIYTNSLASRFQPVLRYL